MVSRIKLCAVIALGVYGVLFFILTTLETLSLQTTFALYRKVECSPTRRHSRFERVVPFKDAACGTLPALDWLFSEDRAL